MYISVFVSAVCHDAALGFSKAQLETAGNNKKLNSKKAAYNKEKLADGVLCRNAALAGAAVAVRAHEAVVAVLDFACPGADVQVPSTPIVQKQSASESDASSVSSGSSGFRNNPRGSLRNTLVPMTNHLAMISKAMETHMANNHGNSNQTVLMALLEHAQERDEQREVAVAKRVALENSARCAMLRMLASINK